VIKILGVLAFFLTANAPVSGVAPAIIVTVAAVLLKQRKVRYDS
jgi:hypothetical protein